MVQPRPNEGAYPDDGDEMTILTASDRSALRPLHMDAKSVAFFVFAGLAVAHHMPTNSTLRYQCGMPRTAAGCICGTTGVVDEGISSSVGGGGADFEAGGCGGCGK